jgi:hypothetical protein
MLTPIRLADLSLDISDEELRTIEDTAASGQISDETRDRIARIGRFLMRLGQFGREDAKVGGTVNEEILQGIWRATEHGDQ